MSARLLSSGGKAICPKARFRCISVGCAGSGHNAFGVSWNDQSPQRLRRVTPHMLRHSCVVAVLQAGVDVSVIRDYLGHASVATTSRYITTNLQMKRQILDAFWKRAGLAPAWARKWQPSPKLLTFLQQF